jgi:hypothetical protein
VAELTDETLMAFADKALDKPEHDRIAAILAKQPELMKKVEIFENTRRTLEASFKSVHDQPVSAELVEYVRSLPIGPRPVIDLGAARARRSAAAGRDANGIRLSWQAAALAASLCLVLGGVVDRYWMPAVVSEQAAVEAASWPVQIALETVAGGTEVAMPNGQAGSMRVKPVLTFRANDKSFCRQYEIGGGEVTPSIAVACRSVAGVWNVLAQEPRSASAGTGGSGLSTASGPGGEKVGLIVDRLIAGDALEAKDEKAAIEGRWKR